MLKASNRQKRGTRPALPRVVFGLLWVMALILIPWTLYLSFSLPADHLDRRWNLAWTGFDIGLALSLALTAYWGLRRSAAVSIASAAAGTFLLIDAWFDCVTAKQGNEYFVSLLTAACVEVPVALLCFWITVRTYRRGFARSRS